MVKLPGFGYGQLNIIIVFMLCMAILYSSSMKLKIAKHKNKYNLENEYSISNIIFQDSIKFYKIHKDSIKKYYLYNQINSNNINTKHNPIIVFYNDNATSTLQSIFILYYKNTKSKIENFKLRNKKNYNIFITSNELLESKNINIEEISSILNISSTYIIGDIGIEYILKNISTEQLIKKFGTTRYCDLHDIEKCN